MSVLCPWHLSPHGNSTDPGWNFGPCCHLFVCGVLCAQDVLVPAASWHSSPVHSPRISPSVLLPSEVLLRVAVSPMVSPCSPPCPGWYCCPTQTFPMSVAFPQSYVASLCPPGMFPAMSPPCRALCSVPMSPRMSPASCKAPLCVPRVSSAVSRSVPGEMDPNPSWVWESPQGMVRMQAGLGVVGSVGSVGARWRGDVSCPHQCPRAGVPRVGRAWWGLCPARGQGLGLQGARAAPGLCPPCQQVSRGQGPAGNL